MKERLARYGSQVQAWAARHPWLQHHVDAVRRANGLRFTKWAAAMGLFAYLSLFPVAALAFVAVSVVLERFPELQREAEQALSERLLSVVDVSGEVDLSGVADAALAAGVVGVIGLVVAGLGWIDTTIEATRRMLGALRRPRAYPVIWLENVGILLVTGAVLLIALSLSLVVRTATSEVGEWLGLPQGAWRSTGLPMVTELITALMVFIVLAGLYTFAWRRPDRSRRAVVLGAAMAVLGYEVLRFGAELFVGRTLTNPVYGALAVAAALLLLVYFMSSVVLYCACWIAVVEGRPVPAEQDAFEERVGGGAVVLPSEEPPRSDDGPPALT